MDKKEVFRERAVRGWRGRRERRDAKLERLGVRPGAALTTLRVYRADADALRAYGVTAALAFHQVVEAAKKILFWDWVDELGAAFPARIPLEVRAEGKRGGRKVFRHFPGVPLRLPPGVQKRLADAGRGGMDGATRTGARVNVCTSGGAGAEAPRRAGGDGF